jgi:hypothetical protein
MGLKSATYSFQNDIRTSGQNFSFPAVFINDSEGIQQWSLLLKKIQYWD